MYDLWAEAKGLSFRKRDVAENVLRNLTIGRRCWSLFLSAQGSENVQQEPALWIPVSHHGAVCQRRSCIPVWKQRVWERPVWGGRGELWAAAARQGAAPEEHVQGETGGHRLPEQRHSGGRHSEQHRFAVPLPSKNIGVLCTLLASRSGPVKAFLWCKV